MKSSLPLLKLMLLLLPTVSAVLMVTRAGSVPLLPMINATHHNSTLNNATIQNDATSTLDAAPTIDDATTIDITTTIDDVPTIDVATTFVNATTMDDATTIDDTTTNDVATTIDDATTDDTRPRRHNNAEVPARRDVPGATVGDAVADTDSDITTPGGGAERRQLRLAVFADPDLLRLLAARNPYEPPEAAHRFITTTVAAMEGVLQQAFTGDEELRIRLVQVGVWAEERAVPLRTQGQAGGTLQTFCQWVSSRRPPREDSLHWHHALLLTGKDLFESTPSSLGVTYRNGLCHPSSACSVVETQSFKAVYVAAHELAHSMGVPHDGQSSARRCPSQGFLMGQALAEDSFSWSNCSKEAFPAILKENSCLEVIREDRKSSVPFRLNHTNRGLPELDHDRRGLPELDHDRRRLPELDHDRRGLPELDHDHRGLPELDHDHRGLPELDHSSGGLPGQKYPADEQCRVAFGSEYKAVAATQSICEYLMCTNGLLTQGAHPALTGTSCGNSLVCVAGTCQQQDIYSSAPNGPPTVPPFAPPFAPPYRPPYGGYFTFPLATIPEAVLRLPKPLRCALLPPFLHIFVGCQSFAIDNLQGPGSSASLPQVPQAEGPIPFPAPSSAPRVTPSKNVAYQLRSVAPPASPASPSTVTAFPSFVLASPRITTTSSRFITASPSFVTTSSFITTPSIINSSVLVASPGDIVFTNDIRTSPSNLRLSPSTPSASLSLEGVTTTVIGEAQPHVKHSTVTLLIKNKENSKSRVTENVRDITNRKTYAERSESVTEKHKIEAPNEKFKAKLLIESKYLVEGEEKTGERNMNVVAAEISMMGISTDSNGTELATDRSSVVVSEEGESDAVLSIQDFDISGSNLRFSIPSQLLRRLLAPPSSHMTTDGQPTGAPGITTTPAQDLLDGGAAGVSLTKRHSLGTEPNRPTFLRAAFRQVPILAATAPRHTWVSRTMPCSRTCGGGTRLVTQVCVDIMSQEHVVAEKLCEGLPNYVAPYNQSCNTFSCVTPRWVTGPWSLCSEWCGVGLQRRQVSCGVPLVHNASPVAAGYLLDPSSCEDQHPKDVRLCDGVCLPVDCTMMGNSLHPACYKQLKDSPLEQDHLG